jgi:hypothetical protein
MYRAPTQRAEALGVDTVRNIVKGELEWEFYPQELPEWGVDAQVGIVDADELVTGQLIALQIKGGASYFSKENKTGWLFQENNDHLAYWLGQSLPVVLVLVAPDGTAYWEHFNTRTIKENKKGFSLTVPRSQVFNGAARESLLQIAGRCGGLVAALPRNYAVLPSDARRCLERAALVDALAGARLADRLAEKRAKPQYVVSTVLSVPPTWLTLSPAVHDLWLALASFAREHAFDREASQGFLNAAESGGPGAARARALAGLSLMFVDREAAGGHLRVARGGGAVLLADVGLAFLDVPLNDARAVEVPPSMRDASADDLNAEPTVLNFLAEMAQRRGDIETALDYRRRALRYSLDDPSMALALARTLWLRVMKAKSPSLRDEREALQHAQAALQDRRRWAGPSAEALALLLEIHITSHNLAMVLRAALPVSEGGTALESESRQPEIAGHGGAVAHGVGNVHAFEFFKAQLQDGPELHELQAIEREEGLAAPDQVALWENILDEATDDEMVVRCARRLASLGAWSQKLDHMHARSVLPEDIYETLRAVCRACAGELEIGLAKLRDLANNTSQAAMELVLVLESHDVEAAIDECEHQIERWHRPDLRTHLITLHIRHGGEERAAELVEQNIANESFAAEIRLAWCSWYVLYRARRGEFAPAVALAEDGLALGEDANLAWNLVSALVEDGKLSRAREALARYRPMPLSEDECRLWLRLHLGTDVSADDARQMVLLVRDQPPGPVRDMAVTLLVREVILRPEATGRTPYPAELTTEVKEFVELFRHVPGAHI